MVVHRCIDVQLGDVVGYLDGDNVGIGIILVTLVLLIEALDFVRSGITIFILASLLGPIDKSGNLST